MWRTHVRWNPLFFCEVHGMMCVRVCEGRVDVSTVCEEYYYDVGALFHFSF